jgi:hypothetical protein
MSESLYFVDCKICGVDRPLLSIVMLLTSVATIDTTAAGGGDEDRIIKVKVQLVEDNDDNDGLGWALGGKSNRNIETLILEIEDPWFGRQSNN